MMINRLIIIVLALGSFISINAQQLPHYTQYMYNMSVVNPAYVLDEPGTIQLGSLYRMQWYGADGAPKTANVFAHLPLSDKIELSVNYVNDRIGDVTRIDQNMFNVDFAYKIKMNDNLKLSMGLKAGVNHLGLDFSRSNLQLDPAFQNTNTTSMLVGPGVFLFHKKYYVGLSSPNVLPNTIKSDNKGLYQSNPHLYLIGGYVFNISNSLKFKPSTVLKQVTGSPVSFDVSANFLLNEMFEIGASYRSEDAVTAMIGVYVLPNLRIGYAYDYVTSDLGTFNSGSHEIILLYKFDLIGLSKKYLSPRFY